MNKFIDEVESFIESSENNDQIEFTDTIIVPSILAGVPFPQGFQLPNQFSENHIFSFKDIKLKEIQFYS